MKFRRQKDDYAQLKSRLYLRLALISVVAFLMIFGFYLLVWQGRGSEFVVEIIQVLFNRDYDSAVSLYTRIFRSNMNIIWFGAVAVVFFLLLRTIPNWLAQHLDIVTQGIDDLLTSKDEIHLPTEMVAIERKLNAVKRELKHRTLEAQLAEQRKNDLVMYLAHDIRTPLTSVIGYLNLLSEAPDMPAEQKAKYVNITLDKANRLEKMINEFFEITRYNLQQISLSTGTIDLYYMLVQLTDELSPLLHENGNTAVLRADENLMIYGDPDKLARVFNNVMKNAAAYSYPNTEILVTAEEVKDVIRISFLNKGKTIPKEKLSSIFEKFYRLDESRTSNTGGAGLGLAIAKEIIDLHGGDITVTSENETVIFTITLPTTHEEKAR